VGHDAEALAREHGTPLFVYDRTRFAENARRLQAALAAVGIPFRVRFALKANPLPEVLSLDPAARLLRLCGPWTWQICHRGTAMAGIEWLGFS